jgi:hypothetical protein
MPRIIEGADSACCELAECVAALGETGFEPEDEASLAMQPAGCGGWATIAHFWVTSC